MKKSDEGLYTKVKKEHRRAVIHCGTVRVSSEFYLRHTDSVQTSRKARLYFNPGKWSVERMKSSLV